MNKKTKTYKYESEEYKFNKELFNKRICQYKLEHNISKSSDLEAEIAQKLGIADSTIRGWKAGISAPISLEDIEKIAQVFGVNDWTLFLKKVKKENLMKATDRQKDALKRIYKSVLVFLNEFKESNGFNDYWHTLAYTTYKEYYDSGDSKKSKFANTQIKQKLYEMAENAADKVLRTIENEYLELFRLDNIYEDLTEYVYNVLYESYNGKMDYAYRFEADGINAPTTEEDYLIALKKINELLECYFE